MSASKIKFVPTPASMSLLWTALGDAARKIETSIAIISVDPGIHCAFAVQVFDADQDGAFRSDEDYRATTWVTKAPKRKLSNGKGRSYLDARALSKSMDKAFEIALTRSEGPVNILVAIEDNGGPISRGIQAAWTMAECIGCLKSCAVNTASLLPLSTPCSTRVDEVMDVFVPPVEWVRELGLFGSCKADRQVLLHEMLFGKPPRLLPRNLRMNEHKTDAMLLGMYAGLRKYYKNWTGLLAAVAVAQSTGPVSHFHLENNDAD